MSSRKSQLRALRLGRILRVSLAAAALLAPAIALAQVTPSLPTVHTTGTRRTLSLDEIQSTAIQQLIVDMQETVRAAPGVGLAAPQIGLALQLAVIEDAPEYQANASSDELAERQRAVVPFHVIINQ